MNKKKQNLIENNFLNKKYLAQTILYIKLDQQNLYSFFFDKKKHFKYLFFEYTKWVEN